MDRFAEFQVILSPFVLSRLSVEILFYLFILVFRAAPTAYEGSQAGGRIRTTAAGLRHSHSNAGFELHLQPTPQLMATLDP